MVLSKFTIVKNRSLIGLPPNQVLLTFDDGPNPHQNITERLLDVLLQHGVKACFCIVGDQALKAPDTLKRIYAEGHLLVNHTHTHPGLLFVNEDMLRKEISRCDATIAEILGIPGFQCGYFRPPGGVMTGPVVKVIREDQLRIVPISYFAWDTWYGIANYPTVIHRILNNARKQQGGIYILHDARRLMWDNKVEDPDDPNSGANRGWVPEAVDCLIREFRSMGMATIDAKSSFPPFV